MGKVTNFSGQPVLSLINKIDGQAKKLTHWHLKALQTTTRSTLTGSLTWW